MRFGYILVNESIVTLKLLTLRNVVTVGYQGIKKNMIHSNKIIVLIKEK